MRATFSGPLVEIAEEDERIVLLTGDLGFTVVEPFAERFPDRFFNVGVAEQNMIGVATGLAEAGFVPFAYSIATFATLRAYEFVRNGPVLHHLPGESGRRRRRARIRDERSDALRARGHRGHAHAAGDDRARARGLRAGSDGAEGDQDGPRPDLLQARQERDQDGPGLDGRLRLDGVEQIGAGLDVAIVTTGSITREAAAAIELLEAQGWRSRLVVAACLSPSPAKALVAALRDVPLVVTVEAHYLTGRLGSLVSEVVAESGLGCRVLRCGVAGLPDSVGGEAFLNEAHGLSATRIARAAAEALDLRDTTANTVAAR